MSKGRTLWIESEEGENSRCYDPRELDDSGISGFFESVCLDCHNINPAFKVSCTLRGINKQECPTISAYINGIRK